MTESQGDDGITHRGHERVEITIASIDPDSCDFEPLMKSINGAALTDLSIHDSLHKSYSGDEMDYNYHSSALDVEDIRSVGSYDSYEDHGHPNSMITSIRNKFFSLLNLLPLSPRLFGRLQDVQAVLSSHFYSPVNTSAKSQQSTRAELSEASAALLCVVFAAIILLSGFIANTISQLTGIGPERNIAVLSQGLFYKHTRISPQGTGLAPPIGTTLPAAFVQNDVFADIDDLPLELLDTPIFWHVPRSGGTSMKSIFASCLGKVIATEVGGLDEHRLDDRILTVKKPNGLFVNVDTYTIEGINRAKTLGLVQSKMAEVVFTPFAHESSVLFDRNHRGRMFTLLRHPVDRIISLYYFLRIYDSKVNSQSLEDFVQASGQNWMVRTLTGTMSGPIDETHLNAAKEVLRRKFLIGLMDAKTESFRRFEEFFGWNLPSPHSETCKNEIFYFNWHVKNPHPMPNENDSILVKIQRVNSWDIALYEYAQQLFREQGVLFSSLPR